MFHSCEFQVSSKRRQNEKEGEKYTVKLEWVKKKKLKGREKDQSDEAGIGVEYTALKITLMGRVVCWVKRIKCEKSTFDDDDQ